MPTVTTLEEITLYYRQGSSDKVYQAAIEPCGPGYAVTFAYGRRGATLTTGTKTFEPVGLDEAKAIYDKLVREKTAKGYTPGEDGTPYQQMDKGERATGIVPQLCNPIDETEANLLLTDSAWLTQEKLDGRRMLIRRTGDDIVGVNRKGLIVALTQPIVACATAIPSQQFLIDGECIGDMFVAFDLLQYACINLKGEPYRKRLDRMYRLPIAGPSQPISFAASASKTPDKRTMLAELRRQKKEGIVFKNIDASHTPGRPASGGDWLKLKFTATCSCIVAGTNGSKRSVKLELIEDGKRVSVGNVTIPAGVGVPVAGRVIEVRYLYAYSGGSLYQPVYLGRRDDVGCADCSVRQLKFKASENAEEC